MTTENSMDIHAYKEYITQHFQNHDTVKDFKFHDNKVHSVAWSCNGDRLASGSLDWTIVISNLDNNRVLRKEKSYKLKGSVDQLCWHPTAPSLLASASSEKYMRVFDVRQTRSVQDIALQQGDNINISWSPDGNTIVCGNKNDHLCFIDTREWKVKNDIPFKYEVNEMAFSKECDLLFITTGNGTVDIISMEDYKVLNTIRGHTASCICIEMDPTGKYFAVGSIDALVSLWDLSELCCIKMFSRLDWPIRTLSFSHDGQLLAAGSEDLMIDISMVHTGESVAQVKCDKPTFTVAWHPKKLLLAYALDDLGCVKIYGSP